MRVGFIDSTGREHKFDCNDYDQFFECVKEIITECRRRGFIIVWWSDSLASFRREVKAGAGLMNLLTDLHVSATMMSNEWREG